MKPYLGRCKDCGYVLFAAAENIEDATDFNEVTPGTVYRIRSRVYGRCDQRHKVFALKPIKGTFSKDHKCDSRCLNARGWKCTCSCGGANHGRGYAVTVHEAAGRPSETPQKPSERFLGEEDRYISGEATMTLRKVVGEGETILYTFKTLDRSATIKWFAPAYADPCFNEGELIKFRAYVKRHEDHPIFGKATIVSHLKRIV